jgi:flagellar motor switch protein FliN/FliY
MSEANSQSDVDALMQQLQASNELTADAAQAIDGAAQAAHDLAGIIPDAPPPPPSSTTGAATSAADSATPAPPYTPPPKPNFGQPVNDELHRLLAIEVPVIVQLGSRRLTVGEVMRFSVGAIIEFNKSADEELELLVSNKAVGKGHAVKVGENFGIKISSISPVKETIRKLGGL